MFDADYINSPVRMKHNLGTYLKQAYIVMKNEMVKFTRGKKILVYGALMVLVLALLTGMPYLFGGELPDTTTTLSSYYASFVVILVLLFATLFSSTSLVSEFEERTALILFTRPIKKSSILLGKLMASMVVGIIAVGIYYLVTAIISFIVAGGVASDLFVSFGLAVLYLFCMSGIALLISSVMKKGSTAAIITFIIPLMIFSIISTILMMNDVATWWLPLDASNAILSLFDPTVVTNVSQSAGVLAVWGFVTTIIAYLFFRKRNF